MILYRVIWVIREGHTEKEAMELFKDFPPGLPKAPRVLGFGLGAPSYTLTFDFEFADVATAEKDLAAWRAQPSTIAFMAKWHAVCERNSNRAEVWRILQ